MRSNQRALHYWMGGIYGDLIYHHVAISRSRVVFYNSSKGLGQRDQHRQLRDKAAELLFSQYDAYMGWLRGWVVQRSFEQQMRQLMEQAEEKRTLAWWLRRARSGYVHASVWQQIGARASRLQQSDTHSLPNLCTAWEGLCTS